MTHGNRVRVSGGWGHFDIEYTIYDKDYACRLCDWRSTYEDEVHGHIRDEHSLDEKLEYIATNLGEEGMSRIDILRESWDERDGWFEAMTKRVRSRDWEPEDTEMPAGLNAAK